jgi:hypothetical protein
MVGVLSGGPSEEHSPRRAKLQAESSRLLPDQEGDAKNGQKRALSLRKRQEIQEVLRRMNITVRILTAADCQPNPGRFLDVADKMPRHLNFAAR